MAKYIIKRLLMIIPVLLGVAIVIFTLMYFTPGDPVQMLMPGASEAQINELRDSYGLNDPYFVQLGRFLWNTVRGDFGTSYVDQSSVFRSLMYRLPNTIVIAGSCMLMQIIIAIPLGMAAATHQGKWQDYICMLLAILGVAVPEFLFGMLLLLAFAMKLNWFPSFGVTTAKGFVLPILTAGVVSLGGITRLTRSQMLEVIRSDYLVTARMKGVSERAILYRHALPNALIPVITSMGMSFGRALGGTVVTETVFSVPGIGYYMVTAINNRDYPVVRGAVLLFAVMFALVMLLVDIAYAYIDPRIKAMYEGQQKRKKKKEVAQNG